MNSPKQEDISTTLERLSTTFSTRDIMVRENQLISAESEEQARQLLGENPGFDVIPIKEQGEYRAYLYRNREALQPIQAGDLISDSTPILHLPDLFLDQDFYFVLSSKSIAGYIHFSDLNNQLVKIPYFVLLEAVESRIIEQVEHQIKESDIDILFPKDAGRIKRRQAKLREQNADRGFVNGFYFWQILELARYFQVFSLDEDDINQLDDTRNRVDHPDRPLIKTKKDTISLAQTRALCAKMLDQLGKSGKEVSL